MTQQPSLPEPYVFLSYASVEQDRAFIVADALQQAGIASWLDRHAIAGGTAWSAAIVDGITGCAAFVVLGSARAFRSPNVQRELNLAVEENRPLLPLLLERTEQPREVRYALAGRQWVELLDRALDAWLPDVLRALAGLGIGPRTLLATVEPPVVHLPTPLTSFIGREQELAELATLLGTTRLLTLTGPGGTGKTRLCIAAARLSANRFPDGVWFVDLSGVADPAGVIPAIAVQLDVRESEGRSLAVSLAAYLRRKHLLLVLDNVEQVVGAAMALYDLLAEAPELSLLITSRVLLHLESEREYAVPPLPLPVAGAATLPEHLDANPAVQLFVQRAQAVRASFVLTAENAAAVAAICRRLDGLPLAIELAAARVKLLPPLQLLARLDQRLAFLTGGERNRPTRQQTLRNTIQWSWDLLAAGEQVLFRRLGVFAGGFTLGAAEAVCNADGELDVLEGLTALVDQSLVRQGEQDGELRFSLLATLQEFALEQVETAGEGEALRRAHAAYYTTLAVRAEAASWHSGKLVQDLMRPLDPERDNLFVALGWALTEQDATVGLRLGGALGWWFYLRAPGEGQLWLERLLALPGAAAPGAARGRTLANAALCALPGAMATALAYYEAAAVSLRAEEDLPALSRVLAALGSFRPATELDQAQALTEEALSLARAVGDGFNRARVEVQVGSGLFWQGGDRSSVRGHLEEGLRLAQALDADWVTMFALELLAALAAEEGQHEEARLRWHEAWPIAEVLGDRPHAANILAGLALSASTTGDSEEAEAHWRKSLLLAQDLGSSQAAAACLAGVAGLLSARRRFEPAARLLAAGDRLRGTPEQLYGPNFQAAFTPALAATRAAVRPEAFAEAWTDGRSLSLDEATDLALAELASLAPDA